MIANGRAPSGVTLILYDPQERELLAIVSHIYVVVSVLHICALEG